MMLTEGRGIPLGFLIHSASPHESKLAIQTLEKVNPKLAKLLKRLVADKAYDSDPLREKFSKRGLKLIAPHKENRVKPQQDGRPLRRYRKRWKVERCFAWLHNFRRLVTRWDRKPEIFAAFLRLACITIILRHF
jgi:transposase